MSSQGWSQSSWPEETWTTGSSFGDNAYAQTSAGNFGYPASTQDVPISGDSSWLNVPQGSVESGLSPALSYTSQSSQALYPLSEPEMSVLPPSLDLSFATDSSWSPCEPVACHGAYAGHHSMPHGTYSGQTYGAQPGGMAHAAAPQSSQPQPHHPVFYGHGDHFAYQGHPPVVNRRPLLPRMDLPAVPSQPIYGPQQRELRPQMPMPHGSQFTVSSVSKIAGQSQGSQHRTPVASPSNVSSPVVQRLPPAAEPAFRPEPAASVRPVGPVGYMDHTEDWSSFIHFDQDEQPTVPAASRSDSATPRMYRYDTDRYHSIIAGHAAVSAPLPYAGPKDTVPVDVKPENDAVQGYHHVASAATTTASGDSDEGRHRTHPLYNEGPHEDGLYHCPYEKDPNCGHRATKLKCNYDKFIDSHLKPFRCKVEACSKQEFSSTACLLRHEREAHGMHGHGDRPHLCYYPGCDRGILGNGFPRRYNLFDHMKRVHDHKEGPTSGTASPVLGGQIQNPRRNGRKRKASAGPEVAEPEAQRRRSAPEHAPPTVPSLPQATSAPHAGFVPTSDPFQYADDGHMQYRKTHFRQRLYSQWANQREVIAKQMDYVQSPDDEANLHRLSQNIEELRRLSQEARRG